MTATTSYMIIENGQLIEDGFNGLMPKGELFEAILYAAYDAEVASIDVAELLRDGSAPTRICTEDLVTEWWSADGSRDVWERVVAGKSIGLASRFFSDEVAKMEARAA